MDLITAASPRLIADAAALSAIFPAPADRAAARALLLALAFGEASHALLDPPSGGGRELDGAAARMPNIVRDAAGRITGFAGLSREATGHRLLLEGPAGQAEPTERFGWCPWDGMFLPGLLGAAATLETSCPVTGRPLLLRIDGAATPLPPLASASGDEAVAPVLALPLGAEFDPATARSSFCCHARLLADADAAEAWRGDHPMCLPYTLDAGMLLGRMATRSLAPGDDEPGAEAPASRSAAGRHAEAVR